MSDADKRIAELEAQMAFNQAAYQAERDHYEDQLADLRDLLKRWHGCCAQSCGGSEDVAYEAEQMVGEGD